MTDLKLSSNVAYALELNGLETGYNSKAVVHDVTLRAEVGKITALLGHNGAGKSSTLKAIAGLLPIYSGSVNYLGDEITETRSSDRVRRGIVYLPQERATFATLTVRENLNLGATLERDPAVIHHRREQVLELFPALGQRLGQIAGTMSGGEQRMVSMGIALMAGARMLLLDEPSLGLAPLINQQLLDTVQVLARTEGLAVLLVEQAVSQALDVADHVFVMRNGVIVAEHTREEALARTDWWEVF